MDNNNLLTIAIPTYNRSKNLSEILEQLAKQTKYKYQIIVSDDASPDDTSSVVKNFQRDMPNLELNVNKKNLGFSGNVAKLYELAQTPYIWYLCDDDTVLPNAIEDIIESLIEYEPSVAVYNFKQIDPYGVDVEAGVQETRCYKDPKAIRNYQPIQRTTFLSILVLKRIVDIKDIKKEAYKDNVYVQVTIALRILSERFKFCEVNKCILRRNVGFDYGDFFKFYMVDHLKAVHLVSHVLDNKRFIKWSISDIPSAFKLYMSQKIGLFRYRKHPTKETLSLIIKYYGIYSLLIFMFFPIYFITPSFILKFIYFIMLIKRHGYKRAIEIYAMNINRAFKDSRKTGFINYR